MAAAVSAAPAASSKAATVCEVIRPGEAAETWDRFVDDSPQGCIFCRSWWLDAVCGGNYQTLVVRKGGRILAGAPLPVQRTPWLTRVTMPPLTQTLGVLVAAPGESKYVSRISTEMAIVRVLVDALPPADAFTMHTHRTFTNWLPFHWAGYSQTTRYTYVFDDVADLSLVRQGMAGRVRNTVKKAEKAGIRVEATDDVDAFLEVNRKTFARQGAAMPYGAGLVHRIDEACAARGARTILLASDAGGAVHSAVYLVHDSKCMYNLMQGSDPALRSSGANALAMWRSLELAHERGVAYDFEGSMLEGVESFYRGFGARLVPYFRISRGAARPVARAVLGLRGRTGRLARVLGLRGGRR